VHEASGGGRSRGLVRLTGATAVVGYACALVALGVIALPSRAQEADDAEPRLRLGLSQSLDVRDNIRLDPDSAGTTYSSNTLLSLDYLANFGPNALRFSAETIGRIVDDPVLGNETGFRDPRLGLEYARSAANSRFEVFAEYYRPDLAFSDPLESDSIGEADFFRGGGTREEVTGGVRLETGIEGPLGFVLGADIDRLSYDDTDDPLLFENRTVSGLAGARLRLSPVTEARLDYTYERFTSEDDRDTERDTHDVRVGLDYDISPIASIGVDLGYSDVSEVLVNPDEETTTSGAIGGVRFRRDLPNGALTADFETTLSELGRQNEIELGRSIAFPVGELALTVGVAEGDTFDPEPIGSLAYVTEWPRKRLTIGLSREVTIGDILSEATSTTQFDLSYDVEINRVSALSFDIFYADLSIIGNEAIDDTRDRGSFYATYTRNVTEDWDMLIGYEFRYIDGNDDFGRGTSNGVFFTLQRDFDLLR
jgi:hypothetical protein